MQTTPTPPPDELPKPISDVDQRIAHEFIAMHPITPRKSSHLIDILSYARDGFRYHKLIAFPVTIGILLIAGTVTTLALRANSSDHVATDTSDPDGSHQVFTETSEEKKESTKTGLPAVITTPVPGAATQPVITTPKSGSKTPASPVVTPTTPTPKYREKEPYQVSVITGYRCAHAPSPDDKLSDSTTDGCRHNMNQYDGNRTKCENNGGLYNISTGNCRRFHGTEPVYGTETRYRCPAGTTENAAGQCVYY